MALPSPKELKRIAKACREAGIKTFKADGLELTFSDSFELPKLKETSVERYASDMIPTDEMSDEDKLFWSVGNVEDIVNSKTDGETQ